MMNVTEKLPCLIVTGEFSAGKTQFINALLGQEVLPSEVTATAMPPVWLIYGRDVSFRIDLEGNAHEVFELSDIDVADTLLYVKSVEAELLKHVDIIDTPGNSDPNMPAEAWERMIGYADMIVWCTGATQAWRQSEKSAVRDLPAVLRSQSMLLITQADRIAEGREQNKLKRRVTRDAAQFLPEIRMASLLDDDEVDQLRAEINVMVDQAEDRPGIAFDPVEAVRPEARSRAEQAAAEAAKHAAAAEALARVKAAAQAEIEAQEREKVASRRVSQSLAWAEAEIGAKINGEPNSTSETRPNEKPVAKATRKSKSKPKSAEPKLGGELAEVMSKRVPSRRVQRRRVPTVMYSLKEAPVVQAQEPAEGPVEPMEETPQVPTQNADDARKALWEALMVARSEEMPSN